MPAGGRADPRQRTQARWAIDPHRGTAWQWSQHARAPQGQGKGDESPRELNERLRQQDDAVRLTAASVVARGGAAAAEAQASLLRGWNPFQRQRALQTLGSLGAAALPHVKRVAALLGDRHEMVRTAALEALQQMGPDAAVQARLLLPGFDLDPKSREVITRALLETSKAPPARPGKQTQARFGMTDFHNHRSEKKQLMAQGVEEMLEDPCHHARERGVRILRQAGLANLSMTPWQAAETLGDLVTHDDCSKVRQEAAKTLAPMGEQAARHLAHRMDDKDAQVRRRATQAMASLGPAASPHAAALARRLGRDSETDIRRSAANALAQLGAGVGAKQTQALGRALNDHASSVRVAAQTACNAVLKPREGPMCASWRGDGRCAVSRLHRKQAVSAALQSLEGALRRSPSCPS